MTRKKQQDEATFEGSTVSVLSSITNCTNVNRAAAQFAYDTLKTLEPDSQSIITIRRERYGAYCVTTVTIDSSEGTQTVNFSDEWLHTSTKELDGSSPKRSRRKGKSDQ